MPSRSLFFLSILSIVLNFPSHNAYVSRSTHKQLPKHSLLNTFTIFPLSFRLISYFSHLRRIIFLTLSLSLFAHSLSSVWKTKKNILLYALFLVASFAFELCARVIRKMCSKWWTRREKKLANIMKVWTAKRLWQQLEKSVLVKINVHSIELKAMEKAKKKRKMEFPN